MKRLLVCISNYGSSQLAYLYQVLTALEEIKAFQVEVAVHTTEPINVESRIPVVELLCAPELRYDLAYEHRKVMLELQDDYDIFVYSENDILITERNLLAFEKVSGSLPESYATGFLRYEKSRKYDPDELYLADQHPAGQHVLIEEIVTLNDQPFLKLGNKHHGGFIFNRNQLKQAIGSGKFTFHCPGHRVNLELGATAPYLNCGLTKVIPLNHIDDLLVHHLSNRYIDSNEGIWTARPYTVRKLKQLAEARLHSVQPV